MFSVLVCCPVDGNSLLDTPGAGVASWVAKSKVDNVIKDSGIQMKADLGALGSATLYMLVCLPLNKKNKTIFLLLLLLLFTYYKLQNTYKHNIIYQKNSHAIAVF